MAGRTEDAHAHRPLHGPTTTSCTCGSARAALRPGGCPPRIAHGSVPLERWDVASLAAFLGTAPEVAVLGVARSVAELVELAERWQAHSAERTDSDMPPGVVVIAGSPQDLGVRHRREPCVALTTREVEILELLAGGCTTSDIAERLVLSVHTVRNYVQRILQKLGAHSRAEAVAIALRDQLIRR